LKFTCKFRSIGTKATNYQAKSMRTQINRFFAGNKVFVKYQAQGGILTPTPLAYTLE